MKLFPKYSLPHQKCSCYSELLLMSCTLRYVSSGEGISSCHLVVMKSPWHHLPSASPHRMPRLNQRSSPAGCRLSSSRLRSLTWCPFSRCVIASLNGCQTSCYDSFNLAPPTIDCSTTLTSLGELFWTGLLKRTSKNWASEMANVISKHLHKAWPLTWSKCDPRPELHPSQPP